MEALEQRLKQQISFADLPGWSGQSRMSVREDAHLRQHVPTHAKHAGVLITLDVHSSNSASVILIERQYHPHDRHSGQLSLPGGKYDQTDGSLLQTALREVNEEIGVQEEHLGVLGALSPLYIPVSNFQVHPYVAILRQPVAFKKQPSEVASILHLNLDQLFIDPIPKMDIPVSNGFTLKSVPYYPLDGHIVWGATAMILSEFAHILESYPKFVEIIKSNPRHHE